MLNDNNSRPATRVIVQGFRQLKNGPLRTIKGYANLLAHQEIPVSQALRELQEANDELGFYHLENNKTFQAQLGSKPDEPFEIRELLDRVILFVMTSLVEPNLDIFYFYKEAHYKEEHDQEVRYTEADHTKSEHHYRIGNKAAITSLIFNFILYRVTNTHLNELVSGSVRHPFGFDIHDTETGIKITQKLELEGNLQRSVSDPEQISDQLMALVELTQSRMQSNILEVPVKKSEQRSKAQFSELSSKIISTNSLRYAAIANRLDDLGMKIVNNDESANCYFVDAENPTLRNEDIDRLIETGSVFLLNYRSPVGKRTATYLKYPLRHSQLLFELSQTSLMLARLQSEGPHVMVVDDNPQNLRLVVTHLESLGIRSTSATDGSEALSLYGEHIDLIFMDIHMPGMSGFETTLAIRSSRHPHVPIVALSADLSSDDVSKALSCGINGVFEKPIDRTIIEQALIQHVGYTPEKLEPRKPRTGPLTGQKRKPPNRASRVDSLNIVDVDLSLTRADNRPDLAKEMMEMLIESLPADIEKLNVQCQQGNDLSMSEVVHRMKGACCYCGVPKFEDSIKKLHLLLKSKQALGDERDDKQTSEGIKALILVVNRDATDLIQWHITNRNPFFNRKADQATDPKGQAGTI